MGEPGLRQSHGCGMLRKQNGQGMPAALTASWCQKGEGIGGRGSACLLTTAFHEARSIGRF